MSAPRATLRELAAKLPGKVLLVALVSFVLLLA